MGNHHFCMRIDDDTELRLHEERYAEEYYQLIDRNRVYLREWMPWLDDEQSVQDLRVFMRGSLQQFASNEGFQAGIWYRGRIVGSIGLHDLDWIDRKIEMGYWLSADQQSKGLVTKACKTLLDFVFDEYKLNKVEIHAATGNSRSCAIPERLGFTQEGIIRQAQWLYDHYVDMVIYGLLASEWQQLRGDFSA
ncbi:MAG TPA: GNAT family protein [Ktedonobacteraceae bacterium]|nr:GNAT family protein [Ktedonobacteraceae bacterium]